MNGRTEIAAAITGVLNGVFVLLNTTGLLHLSPELIGGINGFLVPLILVFLGNRVSRVETNAASAAVSADVAAASAAVAADKVTSTAATVSRIENKVNNT
jgi:uncharacterized protein YqgC (DUF456 family)